jgi:hypothetical protein
MTVEKVRVRFISLSVREKKCLGPEKAGRDSATSPGLSGKEPQPPLPSRDAQARRFRLSGKCEDGALVVS